MRRGSGTNLGGGKPNIWGYDIYIILCLELESDYPVPPDASDYLEQDTSMKVGTTDERGTETQITMPSYDHRMNREEEVCVLFVQ